MHSIALRIDESETHLKSVVPLYALLVVVVCLKQQGTQKGHVVVGTLIPHLGEVILGELQSELAVCCPKVRTLNRQTYVKWTNKIRYIFFIWAQ